VLFGGSLDGLKADDLMNIFSNVSSTELPKDQLIEAGVIDVAAACGLCKSKSEVRRLITDGGFYVNNIRITDLTAKVRGDMLVDGRVMVMRAGRKNFCLVKTAG
jgi:tyrosyl-tRNA synthetase